MVDQVKANNKAVTAIILGIVSILTPVFGIALGAIGILMSILAKKEIRKTKQVGKGLASAGFVCSVVGISIQLLFYCYWCTNFFIICLG
ncbi:MAG: DUF4190 domain-containing protein [Bacillaceae bacterium]|nr:DUF4190 domain-containing protein [Bacillaceae bacterium]